MAGALVDALLGSTTEVLVEKAINLASEQIGQFVGFKKDLEKLKDTLIGIQAVLRDAEKRQVTEDSVKHWLENLERVAFDAENLLDDINYEMIRRKVEIRNQMKRKLLKFPFSQEDLFTWRGPSIFKSIHLGSSKRNSSFFLIGEYFEAIHLLVSDCLRARHLMNGLKTCFEVFLCLKSCDHKLFSQSDGAITRKCICKRKDQPC